MLITGVSTASINPALYQRRLLDLANHPCVINLAVCMIMLQLLNTLLIKTAGEQFTSLEFFLSGFCPLPHSSSLPNCHIHVFKIYAHIFPSCFVDICSTLTASDILTPDCCVHCILACLFCEFLTLCNMMVAQASCGACTSEACCCCCCCTDELGDDCSCPCDMDCGIMDACCESSDCLEICMECCGICFPT